MNTRVIAQCLAERLVGAGCPEEAAWETRSSNVPFGFLFAHSVPMSGSLFLPRSLILLFDSPSRFSA